MGYLISYKILNIERKDNPRQVERHHQMSIEGSYLRSIGARLFQRRLGGSYLRLIKVSLVL
jgi:hypothetical protein